MDFRVRPAEFSVGCDAAGDRAAALRWERYARKSAKAKGAYLHMTSTGDAGYPATFVLDRARTFNGASGFTRLRVVFKGPRPVGFPRVIHRSLRYQLSAACSLRWVPSKGKGARSGCPDPTPVRVIANQATTLNLGGGAHLIIPPGAMTPGATVRATYSGSPSGSWDSTQPISAPVQLVADPPDSIHGLLTLEFPIPASQVPPGTDPASAFGIATLDEGYGTWRAVSTTYDAARQMVIAQVPHFSWWNPTTWDWSGLAARVNQDVGQLVGKRAGQPSCRSGAPAWVSSLAGVSMDASVAVRSCAQSEGSVLDVQITNNRPYGMILTYGSGVQWGWHEPGTTQVDMARNRMVDQHVRSNELYLPPLGRASVGILPLSPGMSAPFKIGMDRRTFIADVATEITSDLLIDRIPGVGSCAGYALSTPIPSNSASDLRDAFVGSAGCLSDAYTNMAGAGLVDAVKVSRVESTVGALRTAKMVGKYLVAFGVWWNVLDLFVDGIIVGPAGELGAGFRVGARAGTPTPVQPTPVTPVPVTPTSPPVAPPVVPPPAPTSTVITVNTCNTYGNCDVWNPIWVHSSPGVSSRIADVSRGTQLTARCWAPGRQLTDGSDQTAEDDARQFTSSLWFGVDWGGGRGFVPAVWTTKSESHLGLPAC